MLPADHSYKAPVLAVPDTVVPSPDRTAVAAPLRVEMEARLWIALAVGSLVIAGLLSLAVVIGRLPVFSGLIDDPLFFKRCLVVHVNLSLVVWFYAFLAGLTAICSPASTGVVNRLGFLAAVAGVVCMLAGALARGAQPVLSNYVPVIDHPLFLIGLGLFATGTVATFIHSLATARPIGENAAYPGGLPHDAATGFQAAAVAMVLAGATWIATRTGMPEGLDTWTRYEFSAWGAGHVLQVANAATMLAIWLWLLAKATGKPLFSPARARLLFTLLIAPHFVMPILTWRGPLNNLYHTGATQLMRWGIFPIVTLVLVLGLRHLWKGRHLPTTPTVRLARAGFAASASLTVMGFILGALIRNSTTLIPAHYHASLGAVTAAFMAAAYLVCQAVRRGDGKPGLPTRIWRAARWQLLLFGTGQAIFALGFAIGGVYGLGRKTYGTEQHVRNLGEIAGLTVMGLGGLVAVAGGLFFLFLVLREISGWRRTAV